MVTLTVELADAETRLAELVHEVGAGAEIVITRDGHPVARLVPTAGGRRMDRTPGSARGLFTVPDDFDAPHVPHEGSASEYMRMASDTRREAESREWIEGLIGDVGAE
ncbi:MAG TPA: type II toxin-antitoxin system prevent-host-death family antitoxin [Longimicrobiaceae bacterium]|nr:type II toxin-antitoxin system prevent-host-death family antitoxin [Longimicrobiaceae bacterium]